MAQGANTWERLSYKQCDHGLEDRDGGFLQPQVTLINCLFTFLHYVSSSNP